MSNVLIGIIGVILFIGLALAGALFLGPRFQESTNNSRAAASVQAVAQVASAANMYRVQEGHGAGLVADLISEDYLKSTPANPTSGGGAVVMSGTADTLTGRFATMSLGENGAAVCDAINKQSGIETAQTIADPTDLSTLTGTQGCFNDGGDPAVYTAYAAI